MNKTEKGLYYTSRGKIRKRKVDICKRCERTMPIICKSLCGSCYTTLWNTATPERLAKRAAYIKEYVETNKETILVKDRERSAVQRLNPDIVKHKRNKWYLNKYGLSGEEIDAFKNNGCELCGQLGKRMHTDHNHSTGKYRGVLCSKCNNGLGFFNDDVAQLFKAIEYLTRGKNNELEETAYLFSNTILKALNSANEPDRKN